MYTNEKTPNEEIPDEVLNNFVNKEIMIIGKKSENKNIDKKKNKDIITNFYCYL